MDELKARLEIALAGSVREQALNEFSRQLRLWDVVVPSVEPLVLDFGLQDFYKTGLIEVWIANERAAGYCGKYLFLFSGQTCPLHCHKRKQESFCVVNGQLQVAYDNRTMLLKPGETMMIETGKYHSMTGMGPVLFLELSMPCEIADNFFAETRIPIGGNYKKKASANNNPAPI